MADAQLRLEDDVKTSALRNGFDLQQMVSEHQHLDEQIRTLSALSYLTDQQQYEEALLKKRKLALKDRIEAARRQSGRKSARPCLTGLRLGAYCSRSHQRGT